MRAKDRTRKLRAEAAKQLQFDDDMQVEEVHVQSSDREDEFGPLPGTSAWRALPSAKRAYISQKRTKRARARRHADLETGRRGKRTTW